MVRDNSKQGFFDKLFASGRDALSIKNLIVRGIVFFTFSFLLGVDLFIKNVNADGLLKGVFSSYSQGISRALSSVWVGLRSFFVGESIVGSTGSFIIFILMAIGLIFAFFPIVRTVLDIFDFEQGEALGTIVVFLVVIMIIVVGGAISNGAGVENILSVDDVVDDVVDFPLNDSVVVNETNGVGLLIDLVGDV